MTYLFYVDILGFKNLPKEIAKTDLDENHVREHLILEPFRKAINRLNMEIKKELMIISSLSMNTEIYSIL